MARKSTSNITTSTLPLSKMYINLAVVSSVDPDDDYKAIIFSPKNDILPDPNKNSGVFEWQANILQALNHAAADMIQENDSERTVISLRKLLTIIPEEIDLGLVLRDKFFNPSTTSTTPKENPVLQMYQNEKQKQDEQRKEREEAYQHYLQEQKAEDVESSKELPF